MSSAKKNGFAAYDSKKKHNENRNIKKDDNDQNSSVMPAPLRNMVNDPPEKQKQSSFKNKVPSSVEEMKELQKAMDFLGKSVRSPIGSENNQQERQNQFQQQQQQQQQQQGGWKWARKNSPGDGNNNKLDYGKKKSSIDSNSSNKGKAGDNNKGSREIQSPMGSDTKNNNNNFVKSNNSKGKSSSFDNDSDDATYDSDDSDKGDPTTTAITVARNSNSFMHQSFSGGWEHQDEFVIMEAHDYMRRIKKQLYYMGVNSPFVDVDKVMPGFSSIHAQLGSQLSQQGAVLTPVGAEKNKGTSLMVSSFPADDDDTKSCDINEKCCCEWNIEAIGSGTASLDIFENGKSSDSDSFAIHNSNDLSLVSNFMYCRDSWIDTVEVDSNGDSKINFSKPNILNEHPNSSFSSAVSGEIDDIIAKQLNLPPRPDALDQEEGIEPPGNGATTNIKIGTDDEKKGWVKRLFVRKALQKSSSVRLARKKKLADGANMKGVS